jgi:hypothetical protein
LQQTTLKKKVENNPNHAPKGDSKGGQFTKGDGGSGSDDDKKDTPKGDTPKKRKFTVGSVNDKKKLDSAEKILNDLPDDFVNKDITFNDSPNPRQQGLHQFHKATIHLNNIPDEDIGSVITHELGHAHFGDFKDYDRSSFGAVAMTLPPISTYSDGFKQEITNTMHDLREAKSNFKSLPDDASDDDKRIMRVRFENAQIDHSQAIANYADEYYAELQSYSHGFPPKTKTGVSKEEIDNIIKKTDDALKNPNNKQIYNTSFPSLAIESKCPDCGEDVSIAGPQGRADLKKKKKVALVPNGFEFVEAVDDEWVSFFESINKDKFKKMWDELTIPQRKALLKQLKLNDTITDLDFDKLPDDYVKTMTSLDKSILVNAIAIVTNVALAGLMFNILSAPVKTPIDDIKKEPVTDIKIDRRVNIKVTDRQPHFNQASSFVGEVNYFPEDLSMEVLLNGKLYAFCNVSERLYDSFKGAGSKGAFFNREIKTLHDC